MDEGMAARFAALKRESQARRARHRENAPDILRRCGVQFEARNGGVHLLIETEGRRVDFWPGTGRWIMRGDRGGHALRGFGIFALLRELMPAEKVRAAMGWADE